LAAPLVSLMRSLTQREFEARMAWLEEEMEKPSREDWYAMQVAAEVRRTRVKDPTSVKLPDMRLKSDKLEQVPQGPVTRKEAADKARSRWFGMLGVKKEK
jgi:hypothetical protein